MTAPSRYQAVGTATLTTANGRQVPYLRRRFLPAAGALATLRIHVVRAGERPDLIAAVELGDPEMSWLIADANAVMRPCDLISAGRSVRIPLPFGVPGPPDGQ
jgi:hypothetical protein